MCLEFKGLGLSRPVCFFLVKSHRSIWLWPWNKTAVQPVEDCFIGQTTATEIKREIPDGILFLRQMSRSGWIFFLRASQLRKAIAWVSEKKQLESIGELAASSGQCACLHSQHSESSSLDERGYDKGSLSSPPAPMQFLIPRNEEKRSRIAFSRRRRS